MYWIGHIIWILLIGSGALYWSVMVHGAVRTVASLRRLGTQTPKHPSPWPTLSIIVAACNEAHTLEAATKSKLADDYPGLELILVDDRSTDATGEIADRLAAHDPRVKALHIRVLPQGWLGKVNAMSEGQKHAQGEWLLFSDADTHYAPGVLRRAIAYCEERGLDHLTILPQFWPTSLLVDAATATFARQIYVGFRMWRVQDPQAREFAGVGAFNLVRRSALERTRGFEWLKLEVTDDMVLGQMLKRAGARSEILGGRGQVGLQMYGSFRDLARGAERMGVDLKFSWRVTLISCASILWLELSPFLSLVPGGSLLSHALGWFGLAAAATAQLLIACYQGLRVLPASLIPLGSLAAMAVVGRGGFLAARHQGLSWRGTHYSAQDLLAGRRKEFP